MTEYYRIGKLVAASGLKGEVLLKHSLGKKTSLKGLSALFVEDKKNSFIPYFIEATRIKSDTEVYIKLEGIEIREKAMTIIQKEAWLPEVEFKKFTAKSSPVNLLGYTIINGEDVVGEILEVIEQPHQLLMRLQVQGKEVLIPLHEETLQKIDHKKKQVLVELPEGLLDIYLG